MKRGLLLILFFLLVAGMGVFVWKALRDTQTGTFRLADGSQLTFRGNTVGTNHSYCFGNLFQRMAARIPGQLGETLHGKTVVNVQPSSSTNVVFWFLLRTNPELTKFDPVRLVQDGRAKALFRFKIKDDEGNDQGGSSSHIRRNLPSGDHAVYFYSTGAPPTSPTVRLKLTIWRGPEDQEESAEFIAPNPHYRKQP